jgi:hypothetical protein
MASSTTPTPAGIGRTDFRISRVRSPRLPFVARVSCICCSAPFDVPFGEMFATFTVGGEILGVICDDCCSEETRARIADLRAVGAPRGSR